MRLILFSTLAVIALTFTQCTEQEVQPTSTQSEARNLFRPNQETANSQPTESKKIFTALEVLHNDRYSYLRGERYWVATVRGDFQEGHTYEFIDGIYKRNYHSEAFNRDFETIYLVSKLNSHRGATTPDAEPIEPTSTHTHTATQLELPEGSVALGDIISNPSDYVNQTVQVTGRVTKVNAHILKRHWVHLSDGTEGQHDFVLTTLDEVPVGHVATFVGIIHTDVDFGGGYSFSLIMEQAEFVKTSK